MMKRNIFLVGHLLLCLSKVVHVDTTRPIPAVAGRKQGIMTNKEEAV